MIAGRKTSLIMVVLLGMLVIVYHLGLGIYSASGLEPSPTFEFLYRAAFLCGAVWWLRAEIGIAAEVSMYCPGVMFGLGWLVVIPYYLLKTRGLRGLIPFFALIAIMFVSQTLAAIIALMYSF